MEDFQPVTPAPEPPKSTFGETMKKIAQFLGETGKTVVLSLLAVWLIRSFVVQPFYVRGASMVPTFENGDYLIINEVGYSCLPYVNYCFGSPKRGDVIVFRYPLDTTEYFIKRVIGVPGDQIQVKDGSVFVNGKELQEPYIPSGVFTYGDMSIVLDGGEYWVLGDNRPASSDSRRWGVVPKRDIIGKVWLRGWPVNKIGVIHDPQYPAN